MYRVRTRITSPISTMKSASEEILRLLGHQLSPWELRGTEVCRIYYASCTRSDCNEEIRVHPCGVNWRKTENGYEENRSWRLLFGSMSPSDNRMFFDFALSPLDNTGDTKTRSGYCKIDEYFRNAVLSLDSSYFCTRFRAFK